VGISCTFGFHNWDGCTCTRCGRIRDDRHHWSEDGERCRRCGKIRWPINTVTDRSISFGMNQQVVTSRIGVPDKITRFDDGASFLCYHQSGISIRLSNEGTVTTVFLYSGIKGGYETGEYRCYKGGLPAGLTFESRYNDVVRVLASHYKTNRLDLAPVPSRSIDYEDLGLRFDFVIRTDKLIFLTLTPPKETALALKCGFNPSALQLSPPDETGPEVTQESNAAQTPGPVTTPYAKGEECGLTVVCNNCGKSFRIGKDAVVVTMDDVRNSLAGSVTLSASDTVTPDLIAPISGAQPERVPSLLSQAAELGERIASSLSANPTRKWACYNCKHHNLYSSSSRCDRSPGSPSAVHVHERSDTRATATGKGATSRPSVSSAVVCVTGLEGQGKTTLINAINRWQAREPIVDRVQLEECELSSIDSSHAAVLVVDATLFDLPDILKPVTALAAARVPILAVIMNKIDIMDDPEVHGFTEIALRDRLTECGYPGDTLPIIQLSAMRCLDEPSSCEVWRKVRYAIQQAAP
jgi:hypothetical protein